MTVCLRQADGFFIVFLFCRIKNGLYLCSRKCEMKSANNMKKKTRILLTLILSSLLVFAGVFMKLNHVPFANACLGIGLLAGFIFLYLLIAFFVTVKE